MSNTERKMPEELKEAIRDYRTCTTRELKAHMDMIERIYLSAAPVAQPQDEREAFDLIINAIEHNDTITAAGIRTVFAKELAIARAALDRATPSQDADAARPLQHLDSNEMELELLLRRGPNYQCQAPSCRSFENSPGKWDCCPACGRKGYLCGSFVTDRESPKWKEWEQRMIAKYRPVAAMQAQGEKK